MAVGQGPYNSSSMTITNMAVTASSSPYIGGGYPNLGTSVNPNIWGTAPATPPVPWTACPPHKVGTVIVQDNMLVGTCVHCQSRIELDAAFGHPSLTVDKLEQALAALLDGDTSTAIMTLCVARLELAELQNLVARLHDLYESIAAGLQAELSP